MIGVVIFSLFVSCSTTEILDGPTNGALLKGLSNNGLSIPTSGDPDETRNVCELISSKGYPVQNYEVYTSDGYILSIQRIPLLNKTCKGVVLMLSGLLGSSDDMVLNPVNESIAFIFADCGYDVWLGNVRGSSYGRNHTSMSPDDPKFWDFCVDEMAKYDLPAMIDYILDKTCQQKLYYIGFSQGTTIAFALLSENQEYNDKIKVFAALGPVATVGYTTSGLQYLAPFADEVALLTSMVGMYEFLPNNAFMSDWASSACDSPLNTACAQLLFLINGPEPSQLNETRLGVYVSHYPAGTSVKNMQFWAQQIKSKRFQKFDYGKDGNLARYNQETPPEYCIENISVPVALFWSQADRLADPTDVAHLIPRLKNLAVSSCVKDLYFTHLDFVIGISAEPCVYHEVRSIFESTAYSKSGAKCYC